ncbi:MAG TPA: sigma-70 family RNA polymerase sigma factor [Solirubrobacteraceae bacterium]|nr:sigma-70 family RNA polymerase sigma factor [Solirubrobacteraceae bacterium]
MAVLTRPMDGGSDERDLVAAVRSGDDRAFEILFLRYQKRIASYVRGMVRDHGRAEDITQEVFLSALRRLRADPEPEILFKPWIYEIAKNKCIDAFRRTRTVTEVSFDARDAIGAAEHGRLSQPGDTPDAAVDGKLAIDSLCGAFGGLSPVHHDILVLRELDGLSYREIGDRLGMSRPVVESTLFRARRRLSKEYEEIASGERCLRVQAIVDGSGERTAGVRDQRRMARHLAHCQPCRRYAGRAGMDLGTLTRPAAIAARVAGFLPLPAFLRRRCSGDEAAPLLGHGGSFGQWSANVATTVDPGLLSSWTKAVATAASVAVAGMGAGAALSERVPGIAAHAAPPFVQAVGPGLLGAGAGSTRVHRPQAETSLAGRAQPPRHAAEVQAGAAPPASAGRVTAPPPAAPATESSPSQRRPVRPAMPGSGVPTVPVGAGLTGAGVVGRVLVDVASDAWGAGNTTPGADAAVPHVTAPVTGVAGATDESRATVVADAPPVTGADGSVSSTVTDGLASKTAALSDLGG